LVARPEGTQQAARGLGRGPHANDSSAAFDAQAKLLFSQPAQGSIRVDGDPEGALRQAAKVIRAAYAYPFISHVPMEPQNCVASFQNDKVEIWAPTQNPGPGRAAVARTLGSTPAM